METKEVPVHLLKELLESHEKVRQQEEEKAENTITTLDVLSEFVNSPGPILLATSLACMHAASGVAAAAWIYGDLAASLMIAAGTIGCVGGITNTTKTAYNIWARDKRKRQLEILGRDDELLLIEDKSVE